MGEPPSGCPTRRGRCAIVLLGVKRAALWAGMGRAVYKRKEHKNRERRV